MLTTREGATLSQPPRAIGRDREHFVRRIRPYGVGPPPPRADCCRVKQADNVGSRYNAYFSAHLSGFVRVGVSVDSFWGYRTICYPSMLIHPSWKWNPPIVKTGFPPWRISTRIDVISVSSNFSNRYSPHNDTIKFIGYVFTFLYICYLSFYPVDLVIGRA